MARTARPPGTSAGSGTPSRTPPAPRRRHPRPRQAARQPGARAACTGRPAPHRHQGRRPGPGLPRPRRRWHSLLEPVLILNTPPAATWFPPNAWQPTVNAADSTAGRHRPAIPVTRQGAAAPEGRREKQTERKPGSIAAAWPLVQVLGRWTDLMPPTAEGLAWSLNIQRPTGVLLSGIVVVVA